LTFSGEKNGTRFNPALGKVNSNLGFSVPFYFRVNKSNGTDEKMDGRDSFCDRLSRPQNNGKRTIGPMTDTMCDEQPAQ